MSQYRNPVPTVDVIIEIADGSDSGPGIVLIERKNEPRGWALPGGFVDYGEPLHRAAIREAREETGLIVQLVEQFHCYSDPGRDPRGHTVSAVYLARAQGTPVGADDAVRAQVFYRDGLPDAIAFDHARILDDYFTFRKTGERPPANR